MTRGPDIGIDEFLRELYPAVGPHGGLPWGALEEYWDLRDGDQEAWADRAYARVAALSKLTLPLLDGVVEEVTATRETFWTSTPPAITFGAYAMAKEGDTAGIEEMRATLEANPHLRQSTGDLSTRQTPARRRST